MSTHQKGRLQTKSMMTIQYRLVTLEDRAAIVDIFSTSLIQGETLYKSLGVTRQDIQKELDLSLDVIDYGLSIGAFDSDTGDLIGLAINEIKRPSDPHTVYDPTDPNDSKPVKIERFVNALLSKVDIFKETGVAETVVAEIVYVRWLVVREAYRQRGIGQRLVEETVLNAKNKGFPAVVVIITNNYSRKICERLVFRRLAEMKIQDFVLDGEVVFQNTYPNEYTTLHCLTW